MVNSNQDFSVVMQYLSEIGHDIVTFFYLIIMRSSQYFGQLNVKMKSSTGGTGLDILTPFIPILVLMVALIVITSILSWFLRNYEITFG